MAAAVGIVSIGHAAAIPVKAFVTSLVQGTDAAHSCGKK